MDFPFLIFARAWRGPPEYYSVLIAVITLYVWRQAHGKSRGTTLAAATAWFGAAMLANAAAVLFEGYPAMRYAASTLLLCPAAALLGARRPHHNAWQWIVAAAWLATALPAAQHIMYGAGGEFVVEGVWAGFIWALWGVGAINYLPTRYGWLALFGAICQLLLLAEFMPGARPWGAADVKGRQILLTLLAITAASRVAMRPRAGSGWNRIWLDYRDALGAVWGLRAAERVNSLFKSKGVAFRLGWFGFVDNQGQDVGDETLAATPGLPECFRGVLRRFVDEAWLQQRLEPATDESADATA